MAWSVYQFYAVDETGTILPGAVITVRDSLGVTAMIASDDAGTSKANPFPADDAGLVVFYAQSGTYKISVTYGGATSSYSDVPIGSARGADIGPGPHQVSLNEDGDARWKLRTDGVIEVTGNCFAQATWAGKPVRVTAAALMIVPESFAAGFTFDVQRATPDVVGFLLAGADVFEPSFGDGSGVTAITITTQNGWASVLKPAAGKIAVVGQIEDATP